MADGGGRTPRCTVDHARRGRSRCAPSSGSRLDVEARGRPVERPASGLPRPSRPPGRPTRSSTTAGSATAPLNVEVAVLRRSRVELGGTSAGAPAVTRRNQLVLHLRPGAGPARAAAASTAGPTRRASCSASRPTVLRSTAAGSRPGQRRSVPARSLAGPSVDALAQQVGVAAVPRVLLDHVHARCRAPRCLVVAHVTRPGRTRRRASPRSARAISRASSRRVVHALLGADRAVEVEVPVLVGP